MSRPINISLSNNLISVQNYVNKDKVSSLTKKYIAPTMERPFTNNDSSVTVQAPDRRPRPMKHYRKRLNSSNTYVSSRVGVQSFEVPGGVTRSDNCVANQDCNRVVYENHKLIQNSC